MFLNSRIQLPDPALPLLLHICKGEWYFGNAVLGIIGGDSIWDLLIAPCRGVVDVVDVVVSRL